LPARAPHWVGFASLTNELNTQKFIKNIDEIMGKDEITDAIGKLSGY
jgi:hypothetical protein